MSFDIFLQGFHNGDAAEGDADAVLAVLGPLIRDAGPGWARIETEDGRADIYGTDAPSTGLMFNHATGRHVWDVMFSVAAAGNFVVMPVGCGTLVLDSSAIPHLPHGAPQPIVVMRSGADILRAIEGV